jgi:hypothetical protein
MTIFLQKNIDLNLLFCFTYYSLITGLNNKMWCAMLTRIGLFIFEQFLRIGCLHMVIANGPAHSLKGDLAGPDITIYLKNRRLFWRILVKPDLAIGENIGWQGWVYLPAPILLFGIFLTFPDAPNVMSRITMI